MRENAVDLPSVSLQLQTVIKILVKTVTVYCTKTLLAVPMAELGKEMFLQDSGITSARFLAT